MSNGGLPPYVSIKDLHIQIVGPDYGRCCSIVRGVAKYLRKQNIGSISHVCLRASSNYRDELENADGSAFLFLNPAHTNKTSAKLINDPVIEGMIRWALENPGSSDNIFMLFEELDEEVIQEINQNHEQQVLRDAKYKEVEEGELQDIKEYTFGNCSNFEK